MHSIDLVFLNQGIREFYELLTKQRETGTIQSLSNYLTVNFGWNGRLTGPTIRVVSIPVNLKGKKVGLRSEGNITLDYRKRSGYFRAILRY